MTQVSQSGESGSEGPTAGRLFIRLNTNEFS